MKNFFKPVWRFFRRFQLRRKKIFIASNVRFNRHTGFEGYNAVYEGADISSSIIGRGTYISRGCIMKSTIIGRFCSVAPDVKILIGAHPIDYVSTHPAFFSNRKQAGFSFTGKNLFDEIKYAEKDSIVKIGNDVWIGQGVMIAQGVTIGDGAVIGAGSLVLRDIEPYAVYAGLPARKIRMRFSDDVIDSLCDIRWWDKDIKWLQQNHALFSDIEKFIKHWQ